jgi:hypothetical protein
MTTDFEQQLEQMIPAIRERTPPQRSRLQPLVTTLLGFALGVCVTYSFMQPNDSAQRSEPQETFRLVFDDSHLERLRRPADVFHCVVRVPVQRWDVDQTQWQYGALRNSLLQF